MKKNLLISTIVLVAGSLLAADSDDVKNAAKKLAEKGSYSWTTTIETGGGGGFGGRPSQGKIGKDGIIQVSMTRRDTTTEAFLHGTKGAVKTDAGWRSLADLAEDQGGGFGGGRFLARRLQNFKAPAVEAEELVGRVKELKKEGDAYVGELTEEGAKALLSFGGRGGQGPDISNAKGSVKFWIKDGLLAKYQHHVEGTISFGGNDRDVDRTTTVEIKDVGTTTVSVPEEAKKKLM